LRNSSGYDPDLETVAECGDLLEAEMVRGLLESHGLTPRVVSRDQWVGRAAILGVRNIRGVQVAVPPYELAAAREILEEAEAGVYEELEDPVELVQCPECGSTEVFRQIVSGRVVVVVALASFLVLYLLLRAFSPFNLILFTVFLVFATVILLGKDTWRCRDCGHSWGE
jgi:hypothetical protein